MGYNNEKSGQFDFLKTFGILKRNDLNVQKDELKPENIQKENDNYLIEYCEITHNTDGIFNSTLFEFKTNINDISEVLLQAIKYLSRLRVKGIPVPKNTLLVSVNTDEAYYFNNNKLLKYIEKLYSNSPSLKSRNDPIIEIEYDKKIINCKTNHQSMKEIQEIIDEKEYLKINIDQNCVINFKISGWYF